MTNKIIFLGVLILISRYSWAQGHGIGNGGNAVVCYSDPSRNVVTSIEFFDYWEQSQVKNWGKVDLGAPDLSISEKIKIATRRVARFDPNLAAFIEKQAISIANNIQSYFSKGSALPTVLDANPLVEPKTKNCFREQLAIQYKEVQTGQRRFVISEGYYYHPSFSIDSKVGIILHEAIYRYAILKKDESNSDGVRLFNYFISSQVLDRDKNSITFEEYFSILKKARLDNSKCEERLLGIQESSILAIPSKFGKYAGQAITTCYNQKLKIDAAEIEIPANSEIKDNDDGFSIASQNPEARILVKVINNYSNEVMFQVTQLKVYAFSSDLSISPPDMVFIQANDVRSLTEEQDYPSMYGPLDTFYTCRGIAMQIKKEYGEVVKCKTSFPNQRYLISLEVPFFKSKPLRNFWGLGPSDLDFTEPNLDGYEFAVLGSKKGLRFKNLETASNKITDGASLLVDENLNVVAGGFRSDEENRTLKINGTSFLVTKFEVKNRDGLYKLNFSSSTRIEDPRYNTLRLIVSDVDKAVAEGVPEYCGSFVPKNIRPESGDFSSGSLAVKREYISVGSEQFYDISTRKIVYKVDEDVTVVDKMFCYYKNLETEDY